MKPTTATTRQGHKITYIAGPENARTMRVTATVVPGDEPGVGRLHCEGWGLGAVRRAWGGHGLGEIWGGENVKCHQKQFIKIPQAKRNKRIA